MTGAAFVNTEILARFPRVGVVYGGQSAEREVALGSGHTVIRALREAGYQVAEHDVTGRPALINWLQTTKLDLVFPVLHGRGGEDGTMQGLLEWLGIPYVGSGVLASALAMDKLRSAEECTALASQLEYPVMVKPVHEGSSIGMSRVEDANGLSEACALAFQFDTEVMIEQFVMGKEYTVAVIGDQALPVIGLQPASGFYDYNAKYIADDTHYALPSGLSDAMEAEVKALSVKAFQALGCQGWGRVDLMMDSAGQPFVLEVNTIPGMTDHSLVPKASVAHGWPLPELMHRILATVPEQRA